MDFNEINKVNLNNISPTQKEKKKPAKECPNEQKEDLKQTPSNPTYWQSAIGVKNSAVSFSGNNETFNLLINDSNLKDFQEFSKDMKEEEAIEAIKQFQNPKTGLFDYNIAKKQKELTNLRVCESAALDIAHSCIDGKTGLISELAQYVLDIFYPQKQTEIKKKFKNFRNRLICPIQQIPSDIDYDIPDLLNSLKDKNNEFRKEKPKIHAVIAKVQTLNKVPNELLKFAHENNLPIILL